MASRRPLFWRLLIAGGIAIYGLLLALFGVISWADAVQAVRQTTASRLARLSPHGMPRALLAMDGA